MSFSGDIQKFQKKTRINADTVLRKITLDLTRDLVLATPVKSGLARSSYYFGQERSGAVEKSADKSGQPTLARCAAFTATLNAGGVYYITNNLPYIMALEYGHSKQAPAGMGRVTVARWQQYVNQVVRAL